MFTSTKSLLLITALLFSSVVNVAQDAQQATKTRKGEFTGLVKAGLVASQIYNDDFGGYNKLGGTGGFGVYTPISSSAKIQLELNYAMRGSRKPARPQDGDFTSILFEAHYIDIPILFRSSIWKLDYEVGLCNGILVNTRTEFNNWAPPPYLQGQAFKRYELAFNVGVGVPITDKWYGNARFHYSLTPAAGEIGLVNGFSLVGGAFHNAISLSIVRIIKPKR